MYNGCVIYYRYITRVVLIPFSNDPDSEDLEPVLTPTQRRLADQELFRRIKSASEGARLMISLGRKLSDETAEQELQIILQRLEKIMLQPCKQRLFTSYSWLLLCTIKVCIA